MSEDVSEMFDVFRDNLARAANAKILKICDALGIGVGMTRLIDSFDALATMEALRVIVAALTANLNDGEFEDFIEALAEERKERAKSCAAFRASGGTA